MTSPTRKPVSGYRRQAERPGGYWLWIALKPTLASVSRPTCSGLMARIRQKMHNHYAYIYNELVWNVLKETRRAKKRRCCLPVQRLWGRNSSRCTGAVTATPTMNRWQKACAVGCRLVCLALASGATISAGFENTAPAHVYKTLCARSGCSPAIVACTAANPTVCRGRTMTSSCDVVRHFTQLKCQMMPYLYRQAAAGA